MRISGIKIPEKKHLCVALTSVYGIGYTRAKDILEKVGVEPTSTISALDEKQEMEIRKLVESYTVEGDLRRKQSQT